MRRDLFAALGIAAIAILTTSIFYEFGPLNRSAETLAAYYAHLGLLGPESSPSRALQYLVFITTGFATAWTFLDIPKMAHKWIVVLGTMVLLMGGSATLVTIGVFFEPFSSVFAALVAASLGLVYLLSEPGSRKGLLHLYVGDRISQESFVRLLDRCLPPLFRGQHCEVTVLALRVFNSAALRASLPPAELVEMSARFLRNSGEFLADRGAYLDETSPETVRAYFGLTGEAVAHPNRACAVARELEQRLENLNEELEARFSHRLEYGIALASGEITVGGYRSDHVGRLNAIGPLAEYAHRLCGANAAYGSHILVSAETYAAIRESHAVRPMELMVDASTEVMSEAYELIDRKGELSTTEEKARETFWQAVILYREGRAEEALEKFSELQAATPDDRPLAYFIQRTQALLLGDPESQDAGPLLMHGHARVLQTL